ncbi:MFS general substrate transporter [Gloeophyllum trabeum ATCC 11539]|uniref:MFS general substrate transporter n=1 Tax=Gloeophyllum trabeum (strain ATCC 11539 / FP-39264 / Madison 617) TaxID=670483 RepID=S7S0R9_GLOTA|nr:MFS general substrate transporter [Gloeophyllum trabeum ATCC 11539]EPQ59329.1 MFS general substrate transporter [Gloeophyllum trabeum ATCC 11539]
MAAQDQRPSTAASAATSLTHVHDLHDVGPIPQDLTQGEGESAVPEDKKEEALENVEDDWQHDPINPRNWSSKKKWLMVFLVSFYTFVSPLASSVMAPGLPKIAIHYGITNETIVAMTLSVFLISFALGPLLLAPLSEMYGRTWVLHISNLVFLGLNLGCAFSPTTNSLIAFRFLSGFAGAAPIACGGGSISDMYSERERASAMAVYNMGPLIGPVIGPIIGGYVAETIGFRYVFIIVACLCAFVAALAIPLLQETYAPVIRLRLAKKAGDPEKAAKQHPHLLQEHRSKLHVLWLNVSRPFILLGTSFICFILSAYMALMYGIYYLMFSTFPELFTDVYHFNLGSTGLAYIGLGVGFLLSTILGARWSDPIYGWFCARNGGVQKPEYRIPALIFGSLWVPIGLFWYGWSAQARLHWMMPIVGTGIFGFGLMATFLPIQLYLVDAFTYAASAIAAASVFRSMLGFAFPLFGSQMYAALGVGGGNSLLAGLAIILGIPAPIFIYFYGEKIRARSSLTR